MKAGRLFRIPGFLLCLALTSHGQPVSMDLQTGGSSVQLIWPASVPGTNQSQIYPEYQLQYSSDLRLWKTVPGRFLGIPGRSGSLLSVSQPLQPGPVFYRVRADLATQAQSETASGGADVFGFSAVFAQNLTSLQNLTQDDFATNSSMSGCIPQLSWDPTTAQYWSNFNGPSPVGSFQLTSNELAVFMTNGFVVSEAQASKTFGDAYYRLFSGDVPCFVTTDSILHAWHRSYQSMLEELEEIYVSTLLSGMLSNLSAQLPATAAQYGNGPLSNSVYDADYFLTVALSLWNGQWIHSATGNGQIDSDVAQTLAAIGRLDLESIPIFGGSRQVDCSQFKVRGHYDASDRLRKYFRTMMWCGRMDFRIVTYPPNTEDDLREFGAAIVMNSLLARSGQFTNWSAIESITRTFVGTTDSLTFAQLQSLLQSANIQSLADIPSTEVLRSLQTRLLTGELGVQSIPSDIFYSPLGPEQTRLPRSFTVCGQKFVMDSWALSQMVFDKILTVVEGQPNKVLRRRCSALDMAFSVLANDSTVPEIAARMSNTNGELFRDGLPYHQNLVAARKAIDSQPPDAWTNNIYTAWLAALRALSAPTTASHYPEAMRTRAWAMKNLNTQLASWAELRHDTILYDKQSYSGNELCGYPAGFVEPRPEFWHQMKILAEVTANAIAALPMSGYVVVPSRDPFYPSPIRFSLNWTKSRQVTLALNFAGVMATLEAMSQEELNQMPFTSGQNDFLKNIMEVVKDYTGIKTWSGWYPGLYYVNQLGGSLTQVPGCAIQDLIVADVQTAPPDPDVGDPGAVLEEGIGNVNFLLIAIDNGQDRMVYAGPVLSHYEFEVPGLTRLSDSDWQGVLGSSQRPRCPDWTQSYLVPLGN